MNRYAALAIVFCLLAGCLNQGQGAAMLNGQGDEQSAGSMSAGQIEKVDTGNISFYRNASGVLNSETKVEERKPLDFSGITNENGALIVNYFFSSGCGACKALRPEIDRLEAEYTGVDWREFDIAAINGTLAYQDFAGQHNLSAKQRLVPQVLVNGTIITDRFNINKSLESIIASFGS